MKKIIWPIAFILTFAIPMYAKAQQLPVGSSNVGQMAIAEYTFKVTPAEVDIIAKGLETQPYKDVVPLLQKLREQFTAQQVKAPEAVPVPKEAPEKKE